MDSCRKGEMSLFRENALCPEFVEELVSKWMRWDGFNVIIWMVMTQESINYGPFWKFKRRSGFSLGDEFSRNFPFEWTSALLLKRSENCCFNYLFAGLVLKKHFTLFPAANYPDYGSLGSERTIRHENWYLIVLLYFTIKSKNSNFYVYIEETKLSAPGKKSCVMMMEFASIIKYFVVVNATVWEVCRSRNLIKDFFGDPQRYGRLWSFAVVCLPKWRNNILKHWLFPRIFSSWVFFPLNTGICIFFHFKKIMKVSLSRLQPPSNKICWDSVINITNRRSEPTVSC